MKISEFIVRTRVAWRAPDRNTRITHFIYAKALFSLPAAWRRSMFAGQEHYCPLCESHLSRFLVLHRPYYRWCPVCRSFQRLRLGWLFLNRQPGMLQTVPKRILHIAPETALSLRLSHLSGLDYISADLNNPLANVKMDVQNIQFPDASFDLIYCSHVLEHIDDDYLALGEFYRVLKPGGQAIIMVPVTANATIENPAITDPVERQRLFGQHDHVRRYGPDFPERMESAGFDTTAFNTLDIVTPGEVQLMGLEEKETIFLGKKPPRG